eukprot:GHVS01055306.1.p1 GENE.GHVS01055306.1~~GHVS01055306.1.p1  ORF type:complete len:133 (+),score=15.26 GHVS01055306.1:471-869(+)
MQHQLRQSYERKHRRRNKRRRRRFVDEWRSTVRWCRRVSCHDRVESYVPESVNYHFLRTCNYMCGFLRTCNYMCGFCFHTAINSHVATIQESCIALRKLADAGMKKINFSGGEPFLKAAMLGCVDTAKTHLL